MYGIELLIKEHVFLSHILYDLCFFSNFVRE